MIDCTVYQEVKSGEMSEAVIKKIISAALRRLKKTNGVVSVHLVGTSRMRTMNRIYRGLDRPTDVLSFSALEGKQIDTRADEIGDIFICIPYIRAQAKRVGVSYREECSRMLIHGVLHALGYDHGKPKEAAKMFALQEDILSSCL